MSLYGSFKNIRIRAIAAAVPENRIENSAYVASQGEEQVQKFEKMTGVKERRHAVNLTTHHLAFQSALALREAGNFSANDVDALLFVSQSPDVRLPATACVLQHELNLKNDLAAFDIGLGCSGFVYSLWQAASLCVSGAAKKVLLLGGDTCSRIVSVDDIANQMLFGDAGFAAIVEVGDDPDCSLNWQLGTDGGGADAICAKGGGFLSQVGKVCLEHENLYMDGLEVFNFTTNAIPPALKSFAENSGCALKDFDAFCFHQANKFILKQIAMMAGFSSLKHLVSIDRYGNTSSASIPLTLCDQREKHPGRTLMAGFGVGLSWGIESYDFTNTQLLPVIDVKEPV